MYTTIKGKYTEAIIFRPEDEIEEYAKAQVKMLCDNEVFKDQDIRVMPDVHPGKVGVIGLTASYYDKIIPNLVGNDIGCGVTCAHITMKRKPDFNQLDKVIKANIPMGTAINKNVYYKDFVPYEFKCRNHLNLSRVNASMCSLGGGNHFIELDKDMEGEYYMTVHTGSRYLGKAINDYYVSEGAKLLKQRGITDIPYELTYLESRDRIFFDYINDVQEAVKFAFMNRMTIITRICSAIGWKVDGAEIINSVHNFIEPVSGIIRKGAIQAYEDLECVIPINAKEGVLICEGKSNFDWLCSAPHGAGRIASREDVVSHHTVSEFKKCMDGIYCSSINKDTLAEAPFAYREMRDILPYLTDTVKIKKRLLPVYNIKAGRDAK